LRRKDNKKWLRRRLKKAKTVTEATKIIEAIYNIGKSRKGVAIR